MFCISLDLDAQPDGAVAGQIDIRQRHIRNPGSVNIGSLRGDAPGLEHAVLGTGEFPPVWRKHAPLVAEVPGRGPHTDFPAVDGQRDIGRPVAVRSRHLGTDLHRKLYFLDATPLNLGIIGELILHKTRCQPQQRRLHPVWIHESIGHIKKADNALRRADTAGRGDRTLGIKAERHGDRDVI
ncbi:hypothetical protein D3C78_1409110 [compost metagenome]